MSIRLQNVSKSYGQLKVLDNISFSIKKGEIVGFLGPNGAGKTTSMKIICQYLNADEGEVMVMDKIANEHALDIKKNIGYLPEHNPLYLDMFVTEYLRFCCKISGVSLSRVSQVIEQTGLRDKYDQKIRTLSKGYRQRVGLAAAIIHDPEVLILDEPSTGLDPNQIKEIRQLIKTLGQSKTVLLSSHILSEVETICDRIIILNQGKIVLDQHLDQIRNNQKQIIVEFDQDVNPSLLSSLPFVETVELSNNSWTITCNDENDHRAHIFDFAVDHRLKILGLTSKNKSLEAQFIA